MTKRSRGRPTPPPPPGVRQIVIYGDRLTIEDDRRGKATVYWTDLKAIRTPKFALDTYLAAGFTLVAKKRQRNRTTNYILQKPITERSA